MYTAALKVLFSKFSMFAIFFFYVRGSWIMQLGQCERGVNLFLLLVWGLLGVNSFTRIHFSPPSPPGCHTHLHLPTRLLTYTHTHSIGCKQAQRSEGQPRRKRNGGVRLWVTLHLQSLCILLLLRTWWGHLTVWCVWQRYREHHTLQFLSGLIMDPPPRSPADLHPVTCRGKGHSR